MKKCARCGGSFLTRFKITLKDNYICKKCADELGWENDFYLRSKLYTYDEIKDGKDAYILNRRKKELKDALLSSVSVKMSGGERSLICTEEERKMYDIICGMFEASGLDPEQLEFKRVSDNYLTIKIEPWEITRIKYTNRAKWIMFPSIGGERIYIEDPEDVQEMADKLSQTVETIDKYHQGLIVRP